MDKSYTREDIRNLIEAKLMRFYGREPEKATEKQIYRATCLVVRDIMSEIWMKSQEKADEMCAKKAYYLSMEFLPGTSLRNNVHNLGLDEAVRGALADIGRNMDDFIAMEPDAGLGNGGLGRLASCYLDAATANEMSVSGMSICYEYGIFKQKIEENRQVEAPDEWLKLGDSWLITKEDEKEEVHFGGRLTEIWDEHGKMKLIHSDYNTVVAIPRDMLITGYDSRVVNVLRLWEATSPISIDMKLFSQGKYLQSMEEKHRAEVISKILYPEDAHVEGKTLRIQQQYFFISASMQGLCRKHFAKYGTLDNLADKAAVHINDTHPTMAIPELMRILIDEYGYEWDPAWNIVKNTVSYTNHTIMPEALEKWPEDLFKSLLPRLHSIVHEINRRFMIELLAAYPYDEQKRREMSIINDGKLYMANLCVAASHKVNGVSSLHSGIIKDQLFSGFSQLTPEKFTNVTNGIAYRRWLCQANPKLSSLLDETIGPGYRKDARELKKFEAFANDNAVLDRLSVIKRENKLVLADYIAKHNGIIVDPDSIFDIQVKRLHEYKRQLLNLFHIMDLYNKIQENPDIDIQPRTFIFGAKAAAGYGMAKEIIALACNLSDMLEKDEKVRGRIKIVFLENYSVSLSEIIMPAAEVSEQISLAGKEASGTGNMKLMINGAVTLGTEDGANVEIHQAVGDDNIFIFGMRVEEVQQLLASGRYSAWECMNSNPDLGKIMNLLNRGINGISFGSIVNSLTTGYNGNADTYCVLADFADYRRAQNDVAAAYRDRKRWERMSLMNIANAGIFSADRAVAEYAERIWGIKPLYD